jgi:transposase-like protein
MALVHVQCPYCQSTGAVKYGKQTNGTQRYRCDNANCARRIFLAQCQPQVRRPEIKRQIVDMTLNKNSIRDIVRVLGVSFAIIIDVLKKN